MKKRIFAAVLTAIVCPLTAFTAHADTLIYNNATLQGTFVPGSNNEIFDYGTSSGGDVNKIIFTYSSTSVTPTVRLRFYRNISPVYSDVGYLIKTITVSNLPSTGGGLSYYQYVLSEDERFTLPSGQFGYSIECQSSTMQLGIAYGGAGQVDELWEYGYDWMYGWGWYPFWFNNAWAGLYMRIYAGPPINEITCDVKGFKFDDADGDGFWDEGEFALPHWEVYIDENGDGAYQATEPNVVTDPNGMYFFENLPAPADYTIREIMQDGWTQTLPGIGLDNEYKLAAEPNTLYTGLDFGNTTAPAVFTISGYVTVNTGEGVADVQVQAAGSITGSTWTDADGHYALDVPAGWSGTLYPSRDRWNFSGCPPYVNVWENKTQDFLAYGPYSGGIGSAESPFQIAAADDLNELSAHSEDWDRSFELVADIDLSEVVYKEAVIAPDTEASLYSHQGPRFTGIFRGNGHVIANLTIEPPANRTPDCMALFGGIDDGCLISELGLVNVQVLGNYYIGDRTDNLAGLVANSYDSTIRDCFVTGFIDGYSYAGGICATCYDGVIERCYSSVTLEASEMAGGICGYINNGQITNCYGRDEIIGGGDIGGICGYNVSSSISHCYAASVITGSGTLGGVCGVSYGSVSGSYWDETISGISESAGGVPMTTAQMQSQSTYVGWDFANTWRICDGMNYPRLQWEPRPVGDFVCPEGVEVTDLMVLADAWLLGPSAADLEPDGVVNLVDFAILAENWLAGTD